MEKYFCNDPLAFYNENKHSVDNTLCRILSSGQYILGPEVTKFEEEFSRYNEVESCAGVASGTDALVLTLRALNIGEGDEVITVAHTALATISAIIAVGATPVLVDIDEYFCLDPKQLPQAISPKSKALIVVHIYGQSADMHPILDFASLHNLPVIEDVAQACGGKYQNKHLGSLGDVGCFSFYPTKNLGAFGDGGAVISKNREFIDKVKRLRQYGWDENRIADNSSTVSRLDEVQAGILRLKLNMLDHANAKRKYIADRYQELLSRYPIDLPRVRDNCVHAYHLYVIKIENRDEFINHLKKYDIHCMVHYPNTAIDQPGYKDKLIAINELPNTIEACNKILSLPLYPELDVDKYFDTLAKSLDAYSF